MPEKRTKKQKLTAALRPPAPKPCFDSGLFFTAIESGTHLEPDIIARGFARFDIEDLAMRVQSDTLGPRSLQAVAAALAHRPGRTALEILHLLARHDWSMVSGTACLSLRSLFERAGLAELDAFTDHPRDEVRDALFRAVMGKQGDRGRLAFLGRLVLGASPAQCLDWLEWLDCYDDADHLQAYPYFLRHAEAESQAFRRIAVRASKDPDAFRTFADELRELARRSNLSRKTLELFATALAAAAPNQPDEALFPYLAQRPPENDPFFPVWCRVYETLCKRARTWTTAVRERWLFSVLHALHNVTGIEELGKNALADLSRRIYEAVEADPDGADTLVSLAKHGQKFDMRDDTLRWLGHNAPGKLRQAITGL